ncbi:HAD-IA family hydrolase [Acetobacteraceae bacterium H6797]|nr:HAD-IA family hydrolase [Acetobacteraceae bacterium H6797]
MKPPAPKAIVWDWDNTLVDAWAGVQAGMNAALAAFGLPLWTKEEVRARARLALAEAFPPLFGAEWERARTIFYEAVHADHLKVLTPLPGSLTALEAASYLPQAVVSNKQGGILRAESAHLGWDRFFGAVVGAGDTPRGKPDPSAIFLALSRLGIAPGRDVWFIGDTGVDMQAARAAGCSAILLGDAAHDGGVMMLQPDAHFADGEELTRDILSLAKEGRPG